MKSIGRQTIWRTGLLALALTGIAAETADREPRSILANSNFSEAGGAEAQPEWWTIDPSLLAEKKVFRQKKSEDSPEWIVVAAPGTYAILQQTVMLTPGQKYTVKIIARARTEGSLLGVCQYDLAGNISQIMWQAPLTPEFKPYVKTFTAAPKMKSVALYNLAPGTGPGQGTLEIAGVYLYEGEVAP